MVTPNRLSILVVASLLAFSFNAQAQGGDADQRKDRFDRVLPQAMRENHVDMWIQVIIGTDSLDLGAASGYCVFTDRGDDRIERAVFGYSYGVSDPSLYDIIGEEEGNASGTGLGLETKFDGLREFVAERDPDSIAIGLDGISYIDYGRLAEELGAKYATRIIPAAKLIADFRPKQARRGNIQRRQSSAMLNLVRKEKFELTLPRIMRDHKIDMWINVLREGDFLSADLGSNFGYCVFTDRGGEGVERAIFNADVVDLSAYNIIGGNGPQPPSKGRFKGLGAFVAERDPKVIAVNFSEKLDLADGVSYSDYSLLVEALGDTYAERMVSAEFLIIDFITHRTTGELVLFGRSDSSRRTEQLARQYAKVVPGVSVLSDVDEGTFTRDRDGNETLGGGYVIQRGDLIGTPTLSAYILREGETSLPPMYQKAWDQAMEVQEILRKNILPGPTVRETLEQIERKLEEAGYWHNPHDRWNRDVDQSKTQVHLDLHAWGGSIDIAIPRIAPLDPRSFNEDWAMDLRIPLNHMFTLEFMIHVPVPEWGVGKHIYLPFHDPGVVTKRGVEFPYLPVQGIEVIR